MKPGDYVQISFYLKPEAATALKKHVLDKTGSLRGLSPWLRDVVIAKLREDGVEISDEWAE